MIHGVFVKASSPRVLQTASPFFTQNHVYTKSYGEKCEEQCLTALKSQSTAKNCICLLCLKYPCLPKIVLRFREE